MNNLCFVSNLTSSELASWVQAVGSIFAIIAATLIAVWQSKKQYENAQSLYENEQRHSRIELAKTLSVLGHNCEKAIRHCINQMPDREAIHKIATSEVYLDVGELRIIDNAVASIPLHSLPDSLVCHTMILGATIRQFREKVEAVIHFHRHMDADSFDGLFRTFQELGKSLELTCKDIDSEVNKVQSP